VSKLVADAIQATVNPLELEFDNDAGEEANFTRDKDETEVISTWEVPSTERAMSQL